MSKLPRAIMDPAEYQSEFPNLFIYGESGSGKTPWLMQLPNALILAVDPEGTISAKTWGEGTKVWPIKTWSDFVTAYEWLEGNPDEFKYVVVDTITMLQTRLLREILKNAHEKNPAKFDLDIPQIQDHQRWQNVLKRFVMDMNDLPLTVIWTAQEQLRENTDGEEMVLPLLPGGKNGFEIAMWVISIQHVVGRIGSKAVATKSGKTVNQRKILFRKLPPFQARDRTGTLPATMTIATGDTLQATAMDMMKFIEDGGAAALARAAKLVEERDDREEDGGTKEADAELDDDDGQDEYGDPDEMMTGSTGDDYGDADIAESQNPPELRDDPTDVPEDYVPPRRKAAAKAAPKKTTGRNFRAAKDEE